MADGKRCGDLSNVGVVGVVPEAYCLQLLVDDMFSYLSIRSSLEFFG